MNWDQFEGKWRQYKGQVRERWGALTDNDVHVIAGKRDDLIGKIQERYGCEKERAAKEVDSFVRTLKEQSMEDVRQPRWYVVDSRSLSEHIEDPRTATNELREWYNEAVHLGR
jgi:uncharacterized protein YjbJ (UPF0337 family)